MKRKIKIKEFWVKSRTDNDLRLNDLNVRIPAQKAVNLYALNPNLNRHQIAESDVEGSLRTCYDQNKLLKLPFAPPPPDQYKSSEYQIATKPIPSRTKSTLVMDVVKDDDVEELSHYDFNSDDVERFASGVSDPIRVESEMSIDEFAIVVPADEESDTPTEAISSKTHVVAAGNVDGDLHGLHRSYYVVAPVEDEGLSNTEKQGEIDTKNLRQYAEADNGFYKVKPVNK